MAGNIEALRASAARLRAIVEPLDTSQLDLPAYPAGWTIADVLSHLGSVAVILQRWLEDTINEKSTPSDFAQNTWENWNARPSQLRATDALVADQTLLDRLGSVTDEERAGFQFSIGPWTVDFEGFIGLRLNEHALHTWDVEVALDPSATVAPDATRLVVDRLEMLVRFTGKPTGTQHRVAVRTSEPRREFVITFAVDSVSLAPAEPAEPDEPDLEISAEAFIRLVYGRLDPDHTPVTRGPADLDELRRAFPGP